MKGATKLFRIFGIDIKLHFSWWFVFILLSWILADSYFPEISPGLAVKTYWFMGITAALLLFVSVLLHELSHSLVAKARKIKVESITLFFFGGVAGITDEEMSPTSEFQMAIAGPLFSLALGFIFLFINKLNGNVVWDGITNYLYFINFVLAAFNMVPAFPLDGGRALRAILHSYYHDLEKATRIAAKGGKFFAGVMIILGIISLFSGAGGGLWFIFLGAFLYFIAGASYEQVLVKSVLGKITVDNVMLKKVIFLKPEMKFADFLKKHENSGKNVFVVKGKSFSGILDLDRIKRTPAGLNTILQLKQIAVPLSVLKSLSKKDTAYTAFKNFAIQNIGMLPVNEGKEVIGYVSREAVMHRLNWSLNFSDGELNKKRGRRSK